MKNRDLLQRAAGQREAALGHVSYTAGTAANRSKLLDMFRADGMTELQAQQALRDTVKALQKRGALRKPTKAEKKAEKAAKAAARAAQAGEQVKA